MHAHIHTHTHNPHAQSHHWLRWKNRRERHEMFVAGTKIEQRSFEGGLQRLQKITCKPCASFFLVMTFSYTLHDGSFFLQGVSLTVPCCFTWGVSLSLTHPVLVYVGAPLACPHAGLYGVFLLHAQCWFRGKVSLTHPMLTSFSWECPS